MGPNGHKLHHRKFFFSFWKYDPSGVWPGWEVPGGLALDFPVPEPQSLDRYLDFFHFLKRKNELPKQG